MPWTASARKHPQHSPKLATEQECRRQMVKCAIVSDEYIFQPRGDCSLAKNTELGQALKVLISPCAPPCIANGIEKVNWKLRLGRGEERAFRLKPYLGYLRLPPYCASNLSTQSLLGGTQEKSLAPFRPDVFRRRVVRPGVGEPIPTSPSSSRSKPTLLPKL